MKTVQVKKNALLVLGALSFVTVLLSGCLKESESSTTSYYTYLSLMHLAPRAPAIEVYFDNTKASSEVSPGTVSSTYSAIDPASIAISFKKSGSDSIVASLGTYTYDTSRYYTLLLYNYDSTHVNAFKINDDFSVLTSDKAYYRFFHLCPDFDNVDLYFDNTLMDEERQYADNTLDNYWNQFFATSSTTHNVYVKKTGTDSVIAQANSQYFGQGQAYTLYLKGIIGGSGSNAISLEVLQAAD